MTCMMSHTMSMLYIYHVWFRLDVVLIPRGIHCSVGGYGDPVTVCVCCLTLQRLAVGVAGSHGNGCLGHPRAPAPTSPCCEGEGRHLVAAAGGGEGSLSAEVT